MAAPTAMVVTQLPAAIAVPPVVDLLPSAPGAGQFGFRACDAVNGNSLALDGTTHVIFFNSDTNPHTVTITSAPDPYGRSRSVSAHNIPAGDYLITADFPQVGWNSGGGNICDITASDATVLYLAVQRAPGS